MANFTEAAIKQAFIQLLEERPFHKITVKDVVTRCGINRNSFYYHFQDLPALAEEIGKDCCDRIISQFSSMDTLQDCLQAAAEFSIQNRRAIMHLYRSEDRQMLERYLWKICDHAVEQYIRNAFSDVKVRETDLKLISLHLRALCFGQIMNWLENSVPQEEILEAIPQIARLNHLVLSGFIKSLEDDET